MTVLRDLAEDRIRVSEAATLTGLERRQVFRLAKAFRRRGPVALVSRRRGKPSNRSYPSVLRTEVIGIIRERYADFGPTLAGEKLTELHGIELSRETIRQWMMAAGLWKDRGQRLKPVHQPTRVRGQEKSESKSNCAEESIRRYMNAVTSQNLEKALLPLLEKLSKSAGPGWLRLGRCTQDRTSRRDRWRRCGREL